VKAQRTRAKNLARPTRGDRQRREFLSPFLPLAFLISTGHTFRENKEVDLIAALAVLGDRGAAAEDLVVRMGGGNENVQWSALIG
jgi:hypothetical protein